MISNVLGERGDSVLMQNPLVSIVIPVVNGKDKIVKCLESLESIEYSPTEVIVVDNGSTDGTIEIIENRFPHVQLICNEKNLFLAEARNIGLQNAQGGFVFLLDYDNVVAPFTVRNLIDAMLDDECIGIAGPIAYYLADPERIWSAGTYISLLTSRNKHVGHRQLNQGQITRIQEVDCFPNAFMVRKSMVAQIGGFDSRRYPQAFQESDLGLRARRKGYRVVLVPTAEVYHDILPPAAGLTAWARELHLIGQSTTASHKTYYHGRNRLIFMRQHAGVKFWAYLLLFEPVYVIFYVLLLLLNRRYDLMKMYLAGAKDGIRMSLAR